MMQRIYEKERINYIDVQILCGGYEIVQQHLGAVFGGTEVVAGCGEGDGWCVVDMGGGLAVLLTLTGRWSAVFLMLELYSSMVSAKV